MTSVRRFSVVLLSVVLAATVLIALVVPAVSSDKSRTVYVSATAASGGDGSKNHPYSTITAALKDAGSDGAATRIIIDAGTYREGELRLSDENDALVAASGTTPVLSGAEAVKGSAFTRDASGAWRSTRSDFVRFNDVGTTNPDISQQSVARFIEAVRVNGTALTQVTSADQLASTPNSFYVDDPNPVRRTADQDKATSWTSPGHTGTSYLLSPDIALTSSSSVEIVQHARALTISGAGTSVQGLTIQDYAPTQVWKYEDPVWGTDAGGAAVTMTGKGSSIKDTTITGITSGTAVAVGAGADGATLRSNRIVNNGGVGGGSNRAANVSWIGNTFSGNNANSTDLGFSSVGCEAYCTMADLKSTHSKGLVVASNTFDHSGTGMSSDSMESFSSAPGAIHALWLDEGITGASIVRNRFTNVEGVSILDEVNGATSPTKGGNVIASNYISGGATGIMLSGAGDDDVWNNTILGSVDPIYIREDERVDGNNRKGGSPESWSVAIGAQWDSRGNTVINNVIGDKPAEPVPAADDPGHRYQQLITIEDVASSHDGSSSPSHLQIESLDHNAYFRGGNVSDQWIVNYPLAGGQVIKESSISDVLGTGNPAIPHLETGSTDSTSSATDQVDASTGAASSGSSLATGGRPLSAPVAAALGLNEGDAAPIGVIPAK